MNTIVKWDELELCNNQYESKSTDRHKQMYESKINEQMARHIGLVFHKVYLWSQYSKSGW